MLILLGEISVFVGSSDPRAEVLINLLCFNSAVIGSSDLTLKVPITV
jgi:hypothetical protein